MHALKLQHHDKSGQAWDSKLSNVIIVLYVGDDENVLDEIYALTNPTVEVFRIESALGAIKWMETTGTVPDAIFSEFYLPGMNGLSFHKQLQLEALSKTPLFILLGNRKLNRHDIREALKQRVDDVMEKPLDATRVASRIAFLFKMKRHLKVVRVVNNLWTDKTSIGKRIFDILVSSTALILLSPILVLVALLIKLDSKGPVSYHSKRVGSGYNVFNFYKFRTMKVGADSLVDDLEHLNQYSKEASGPDGDYCLKCTNADRPCSPILLIDEKAICENHYLRQKKNGSSNFVKFKNDPRVTRLGAFLRRTSIDELPQLFNILKGDMSVVGNRPLPLYEAEQLTTDQWSQRFLAPAGLTGLWQVTKRGRTEMSEEERKELDNEYATIWSFWGDIKLILKTIPALMQKENV